MKKAGFFLGVMLTLLFGNLALAFLLIHLLEVDSKQRIAQMRSDLEKNIISGIQARVETAYCVVRHFADTVPDQAAAEKLAFAAVASIKFDSGNYVWINRMDPSRPTDAPMLVHPIASNIGRNSYDWLDLDRIDSVDVDGAIYPKGSAEFNRLTPTHTGKLFFDLCMRDGHGLVSYYWPKIVDGIPTKTGYRKISFVKYFPKWRIMLGAGAYADEVDKLIASRAKQISASHRLLEFKVELAHLLTSIIIALVTGLLLWRDKHRQIVELEKEIEERRKTEKALLDSEAKFKSIFNFSMEFIALLDLDGRTQKINNTAMSFVEGSYEEVLGSFFWETPWWRGSGEEGRLADSIRRCVKGERIRFETVNCGVGGRRLKVDFSLTPLFDSDGHVILLIAEGRDITLWKEAESALIENERKYRALFDNYKDAVFIMVDGKIVEFNPKSCEIFGCSKDVFAKFDPIGFSPEFQPDGSRSSDLVEGHIAKVMNGETLEFEWTHLRFDKTPFIAEVNLSRIFIGERPHLQAIIRDISARKAAERALKESENNLKITLDSIGEAVVALDAGGRVVRMNPSAVKLLGFGFEEAKGRPLQEMLSFSDAYGDAPLEDPAARILFHGEGRVLDSMVAIRRPDKTRLVLAGSASPIRDQDGALVGAVMALRDVTGKLELEEQLRQSQKMEVIGQLAGGVAHDFNNMLQGILGAAEILSSHLSQSSKDLEHVRLIRNAAARSADLTQKLLAFSRKAAMRKEPVDMNDTIFEVAHMLARTLDKKIKLETSLCDGPAFVMGDKAMLHNVLLNLGVNARDAMPDGGRIVFSSERQVLDASFAGSDGMAAKPGDYLKIRVSDCGCGIPERNLSRIFEPFFTTKPTGQGTGLGLSVVYGAVKEHGGLIKVSSELKKGTAFAIFLPLAEIQAEKVQPPAVARREGHGRILIVDDEEIVADVVSETLSDMGYETIVAKSGGEALEVFKARKEEIDLLLVDMIMPDMSGVELMSRLRQLEPGVRGVLSSGYTNDAKADDILKAGAIGFIQKPFSADALGETVAKALRRG